ncbi:TPA: Exc2 family lipoprotein [Salmonella enterica subsp. enterica]|nr:Exc2 family lipoprotein [Salmonella enterica subsp. enterica serovar Veneziana]HBZ8586313.1 Exc2 family lipoprotein [Salmonella enterica subsp. enterica]
MNKNRIWARWCKASCNRYYVYASDDSSDPNFYTNKADTTRMMVPFFQLFRDMGTKESSAGISAEATHSRFGRSAMN